MQCYTLILITLVKKLCSGIWYFRCSRKEEHFELFSFKETMADMNYIQIKEAVEKKLPVLFPIAVIKELFKE